MGGPVGTWHAARPPPGCSLPSLCMLRSWPCSFPTARCCRAWPLSVGSRASYVVGASLLYQKWPDHSAGLSWRLTVHYVSNKPIGQNYHKAGTAGADDVVEIACAILRGEVLLACQAAGEAPPAWGYLNLLAHSDHASLGRIRDFNRARGPLSRWGAVVFELICDILALAPEHDELTELQRNALIPLELEVWDRRTFLYGPEDLDVMVRSKLLGGHYQG